MNPILAVLMLAVVLLLARKFKFVPLGMLLTADQDTPAREGTSFSFAVYQASLIYAGAIVMLNATGYAVKGATATGQIAVGRAKFQVDNSSGQSGDLNVEVEQGTFHYANSTDTDLITIAEIGDVCYIVDDNTVAKTSGVGTRSAAGIIADVDSTGVWVRFGPEVTLGGLAAANNLSEVTPATARANLGANLVALEIDVATLVGTGVYRVVSPVAGTITKIKSVIDGILTTGDATLTAKIGATPVTTGVITITESGSAAGDVDYCAPNGARTVVENDVISVTVGGTNATASGAKVTILIAT
jgi:hypothetical protein